LIVFAICVSMACAAFSNQHIIVNWQTPYQVIDGFGASSSNFPLSLSSDTMDVFYTTSGIGLTLLRTRAFPSMSDCEEDLDPGGECFQAPLGTTTTGELEIARMAVARGAKVWSASWSPPGSMKTNGKFGIGGAMIGDSTHYETLATKLAGFVQLMRANGVPLYALSPQNEPDMSKPYPSATWTPEQIRDFVPYLHAALHSKGVDSTQIMIAEESLWGAFRYARQAMNDPSVARKIGIIAAHNYDGRDPSGPPRLPNRTTQHVWQTEASTFEAYDGGIENAIAWAQRIHYFLSTARVNAFHYWYLSAAPHRRTDNEALTDQNGNLALRAYVIGQWSRFVRPGWHQVDVRNATRALVTAFQSADCRTSTIVAVNPRASSMQVEIAVGNTVQGSMTPWITSSSQSLKRQKEIPVLNGVLSIDLPNQSVVTLVWVSAPQSASLCVIT
jgi:glucuronoarabinoxylan endo-1,4-beta-xylanase